LLSYTRSQYPFAHLGCKTPYTTTLAMARMRAVSLNSSSSSPCSKVYWFFERTQNPGILLTIVILIVISGTIVVILEATSS